MYNSPKSLNFMGFQLIKKSMNTQFFILKILKVYCCQLTYTNILLLTTQRRNSLQGWNLGRYFVSFFIFSIIPWKNNQTVWFFLFFSSLLLRRAYLELASIFFCVSFEIELSIRVQQTSYNRSRRLRTRGVCYAVYKP